MFRMQYRPGDIAYIVGNTRFVETVKIMNVKYGLVTIHLLRTNSYIRVRENRLFPTKEAVEASLPKKEPSHSLMF